MMNVIHRTPDEGPEEILEVHGRGHLGLWWQEVPVWDRGRIGCIGSFEAADEEASSILLESACDRLRELRCDVAIGPMDGNTWRRHRWVVDQGEHSPFFLEPWNSPEWPRWWERAGFEVLSRYSSSRFPLDHKAPDRSKIEERLKRVGVGMRALDVDDYEEELRRIHKVCVEAFAHNFLYTRLSEEEFVAMYGKVREVVTEDCAWIAEREGRCCGFVFGLPDVLALKAGKEADFIVKTLAVLPERRLAGLGSILVERIQEQARELGFRHAIHALQHESNTSLRITQRNGGERIRQYALFSKDLSS